MDACTHAMLSSFASFCPVQDPIPKEGSDPKSKWFFLHQLAYQENVQRLVSQVILGSAKLVIYKLQVGHTLSRDSEDEKGHGGQSPIVSVLM